MIEFSLRRLPNPYAGFPGEEDVHWGIIELRLCGEEIICGQWDVCALAEWFAEHRDELLNKLFPDRYDQYRSLSFVEIHDIIGEQITDHSSREVANRIGDELVEHFSGSRYFFMRGSKIRNFHIGLDYHGKGEISYRDEKSEVFSVFKFDMADFVRIVDAELNRFFNQQIP